MELDFIKWILSYGGYETIPAIKNGQINLPERVNFKDGSIILSGVMSNQKLKRQVVNDAIKGIGEKFDYSFTWRHGDKSLWDGSVFLDGKEIAVTSDHESLTKVKLLALKTIYQLEGGK